jgi:hypothetical protein
MRIINDKQSPLVKVLSERKGSNPGGFCIYNDGRDNLEGYFKYCFGSKIPSGHSFLKAEHQPIYEAITFELARKLGLSTPSFFVLLNKRRNIRFEDPDNLSSNDHSGRPYYFLSKKIREPQISNLDKIGSDMINRERVYLDSLMISDILGKRQNYMIIPADSETFKISYLDLGCSFVNATGGFIYLPNTLRKYSKSSSKKRDRCTLKNKTIVGADNDLLINLEELVYTLGGLTIPTLNPHSRLPISDLISSEEIAEIDDYVVHGLCGSLHDYKERNLLI